MRGVVHSIVLIALRDRFMHGLLVLMLVVCYLSSVFGYTALMEEAATAITLAAGSMRALIMFGLMVFGCFHIHQSLESRELESQLARPISRAQLVLGYFTGFALLALVLVLICAVLVALLQPASWSGFALFAASLFAESLIVVSLAIFAGFALKSGVVSVLVASACYLLARLMGFFLLTLTNRPGIGDPLLTEITNSSLQLVALLTPRLDFFAQTSWLHYGGAVMDGWLIALQTLIYVPMLLCAAILDLRRRGF